MLRKMMSILFLFLFSCSSFAGFDSESFGLIPILHEGRIKPLDTFAQSHLLIIYGKSSLAELKAIDWLAELLFAPASAYKRRVFRIRNIDVTNALNVKHHKDHLFSFNEISYGIKNNLQTVKDLLPLDSKIRSPAQNQLVELFLNSILYFEISKSMGPLDPEFLISDMIIAEKLKLPFGKKISYYDLHKQQKNIVDLVEVIAKKDRNRVSGHERLFMTMINEMSQQFEENQGMEVFKIIPPMSNFKSNGNWYSPWQIFSQDRLSSLVEKYLSGWASIQTAYQTKDEVLWNQSTKESLDFCHKHGVSQTDVQHLAAEYWYNQWDLFSKATFFYLLAFLILSLSWIFHSRLMVMLSFSSFSMGIVSHALGLGLRCYIMERPPVSTLYESILFVGMISVLGSMLYELFRKDSIGIFIGSITGSLLLFISFGYQREGDSMGMLEAVLNTNFWLATHVVTITIGYGCCLVASMLGHVYLVQMFLKNKYKKKNFNLSSLYQSMVGATLYSLFFSLFGTILGGIWADQSWGRFWGWDPKENGAMLVCLWLLALLHGRLAGFLKEKFYAFGLVLTSVVVALAWFGVNLLNVGLHSYGFTDNIAYNLLFFSLFEVSFVLCLFILIFYQEKTFHQREEYSLNSF